MTTAAMASTPEVSAYSRGDCDTPVTEVTRLIERCISEPGIRLPPVLLNIQVIKTVNAMAPTRATTGVKPAGNKPSANPGVWKLHQTMPRTRLELNAPQRV